MSMNSYPNSDPKQCTVSKLSCAQCAHPRPRLRAQRRVVARTEPCRSPLSQHKNHVVIQNHASRAASRVARARPYHSAAAPCRGRAAMCPYAQAKPCRALACACGLLCRNTILLYRDQSWKMGSSPSSFLLHVFFFFFYSSSSLPVTYKMQ